MGRRSNDTSPLTGDEFRARVRRQEERVRKAVAAHGLAAAEAGKLKKAIEEEEEEKLYAQIRDDPEGELGFRDEGQSA